MCERESGKQPGTDKIRGEIYKWMASSEVCTKKTRMAMNKVMEEGIVPKGWKKSKTVMIPKTKKSEPKDHRPIVLTSVG